MKQQFGSTGWLLYNYPLVRILIDVQNALGIGTSKRDRTVLLIEYDPQALPPGHRELSGEPEFRSDLYGDTARLRPCDPRLITGPGQGTHDARNRQYDEELCQTPALFL